MAASKFRILQLVKGLDIGGAHGGAERFGVELSQYLDRDMFDVSVCAFWKRGGKTESRWLGVLQECGIETFFASEWVGRFDLQMYFRGIRRIAERFNSVDIIHSHFQVGTLAAIILKQLGKTRFAIRTAHVSLEWGEGLVPWICRQVFQKWFFPILLDAEVGVSQAIVSRLAHYPGTRLTGKRPRLIHNAICLDAYQNNTARLPSLPLDDQRLIVGSIGRFTRQKGYIYLLQAIPRVLTQVPGLHFILIGDGELRRDLEEKARELGIQDRVLFTGQREDIASLLKSMSLFVLPSLWEGLPTVVLESMACGVPVVATDVPGTDELIHNQVNGILVPPGDPQSLADAIIAVFQQEGFRKRLVEHGQRTVKAFSIVEVASKYKALYCEILNCLYS